MVTDAKLTRLRQRSCQWIAVLRYEFDEGGLNLRAMGLVYSCLLSLAPLLAVSFSMLKALGVHNQLAPFLLKALAPLGDKAADISETVISFVENIQVGVLGFVGMATLFYTVLSLLGKIEESFNHIWRVTQPRRLIRRFSDYLSVILVGPVLLVSALGITASMSSNTLVQSILALEPFGTLYYVMGLIVPTLLVGAAFAFCYIFMPNTRVRILPAFIGGFTAGMAWKVTGSLFAMFLTNSAQYSAIYSGFAVVLLVMIWLYASWVVLLLGGTIAFHCQYPRYLDHGGRRPRLSGLGRERLGLLLMYLIGRSQLRGGPAWNLHRLADTVNLPWEPVEDMLGCLHEADLLRLLDHDDDIFVPARDTDMIRIVDILAALRTNGETPDFGSLGRNCVIGRFLDGDYAIGIEDLQGLTLRDIVANGVEIDDAKSG